MMTLTELDACPSATDGEIAAINLESARRRAWARFRARPAPAGPCGSDPRSGTPRGTIPRRPGRPRPPGNARRAIGARGRLVARGAGSGRGRFDRASFRRRPRPSRARRTDGRPARGDRAPDADDRSGLRRGARRGARCASPDRRCERSARRSWCLSAPCLPISSASPRRTPSIGRRFTPMTTSRRSRWRGSAFSSACCGESWCRNRTGILPRSGIDAPSLTCRPM